MIRSIQPPQKPRGFGRQYGWRAAEGRVKIACCKIADKLPPLCLAGPRERSS